MIETFDIAGYTRISFDDDLDRDNTSIENQKAIIADFVKHKFPGSTLTFYEDRDRSGYTFEQREGYQQMRREMMNHKIDILVVKDFSRFSRRNSRGLVELEDLRDAGIRIISIGDGIDYPKDDEWLKIQFQFLINEMPVTDTSRKVRNVVKRRQADGKWICAAPYGYIINKRQEFEIVPAEAEVIRRIFHLYNEDGWGYKKIANYLTQEGIATPRMAEKERKEAAGEYCKLRAKTAWSIVSVQGILDNDFYIGVLRQGKYRRKKINGANVKQAEEDHIIIEDHHPAIIDERTFATTRSLREKRSTTHYRGSKKYDNVYSGYLICGDCGSPMFAMSRKDLKPAYTCGTYHRRGRQGCTSHHIRVDRLDFLVKLYLDKILKNAGSLLERLNGENLTEEETPIDMEESIKNLSLIMEDLQEELKVTKRQRIRDIMKHPGQEALLEQTYNEMEAELQQRIAGVQNQITLVADRRSTMERVNRAAQTAWQVFEGILQKDSLERPDLELILQQIRVFEDHLEIQLKPDIDGILRSNFEENEAITFLQTAKNHENREFFTNIISDGDPLEIYTEKDGEVIFKKYSPMGDLQDFAAQLCDSIGKNTGHIAAVADRDSIIAVAGAPKRELLEKRNSPELEQLMEQRKNYRYRSGEARLRPAEAVDRYHLGVAAPIIAEGDLMGCVMLLLNENDQEPTESEQKLAQTVAGFLGKQMEN